VVVSLPANGVVSFEADGQTFRLQMSINALIALEGAVGDQTEIRALLDHSGKSGEATLSTLRAAIWAGLTDAHPHLTQADAGNLIQHLGLERAGSLLVQALVAAFPSADPTANPRKATRKRA
jgi:hypothetical protein